MSILVDRHKTRVVVQGITGVYGQAQTKAMLDFGTNVVAGVRPGRGGESVLGIPLFDSVAEAVDATSCNTSVIYVSPRDTLPAAMEAIEGGIELLMVATEFVPSKDTAYLSAASRAAGAWIIGPNTIGMVDPLHQVLLGTLGADFARPGSVGVISRSGTLSIEITKILSGAGIGQSTVVAMGGDIVSGRRPREYLELFERDSDSHAVILIGEVGGLREYEALEFIAEMSKPVVAYIVGVHAPLGTRMGHVGAIAGGKRETARAKKMAFEEAGINVAERPHDLPGIVSRLIGLASTEPLHRKVRES
jgi:succinyl-CoA synthetase alpha subunit